MPDIQPVLRYINKMRKLDVAYFMRVKNALIDFRRGSLDILYRQGVKLSTIPAIRGEIDMLTNRVTSTGSGQAFKIDEVVIWYMERELNILKATGEKNIPSIDRLNAQTFSDRQEVYANTLQKKPAWIDILAQNMELNLTRLSVAGAPVNQAVDRLLSVSIADGRASVYRMATVGAQQQVKNTSWLAGSVLMAALFWATQTITQTVYMKQAIAAIDQNTTDCCLNVHGQIQPLDKPFILVGTPRYADKVDAPPFHWNCRTAMSLYTERMEEKGITTAEMESAAEAELSAREETGRREEIKPSSATSRRP
jgi:hypothetical protein